MKQAKFFQNRFVSAPNNNWLKQININRSPIRILLLFFGFLLTLNLVAQPPQAFNYQAAIRNSSNQPLANANVTVRVSLLEGSVNGTVVYSEDHTTTTNAQGVVSLAVGMGNPKSGNFTTIAWARNSMFIKIDVDVNSSGNFIPMGVSQILSVPYAITSGNGLDTEPGTAGQTLVHNGQRWQASSSILATETGVVINSSSKRNKGEAIFAVRNALGDTIFAVYEDGVKILIDDNPQKSTKGGFAVGGLSSGKIPGSEYLKVTPDSSYIQFNTDTRSAKGGFAVGGLSSGKRLSVPYFTLEPSFIGFNFDLDAQKRSAKGGFAVGGLSSGKNLQPYFILNPDSIRLYIETEERSAKGGFAVGGLSSGKMLTDTYLSLTPQLIQFNFDESLITKSTKGGFAVGGLSSGKSNLFDYFHLRPDSATFALKETAKGISGTFAINTIDTSQITPLFSVDKDCTYIATAVHTAGDMYVQGNVNTTGGVTNVISDADGNIYPIIQIGGQTWMAKNLRTTRYSDGTPITGGPQNTNLYVPVETLPGQTGNPDLYGYLYFGLAITSGKNVCPNGWRVPTYTDWYNLSTTVSYLYVSDTTALLTNLLPWPTLGNTMGSNASGFGAIPSGQAIWNSTLLLTSIGYSDVNSKGYYWNYDQTSGLGAKVFPNPETVNIATPPFTNGFSVRCIKE